MNTACSERRSSLRVSVKVPIRARLWKSVLPDRYAELLNISETGAYFATWHRFRTGDVLDLSTTIQTTDWTNSREWRYLARVVRVQMLDARSRTLGVAVQFDRGPAAQKESHEPLSKAAI